MIEIFISYRRGDIYAELIKEFLDTNLYPGVAFLDVYDLGAGPVQGHLLDQVRSSKVVIVVIGKVFDLRTGELNDQNDYVGQEIRAAHEAHIPILPIVIDKDIDKIKLPDELSNILAIQNRLYFKANDTEQLKGQLPQILPKVLPYLPGYWRRLAEELDRRRKEEVQDQKRRDLVLSLVAIVLAATATILIAWLSFPVVGWMNPKAAEGYKSEEAYFKKEVAELGGDISFPPVPVGYPPKDINVTSKSSNEDLTPSSIVQDNQKDAARRRMSEWWNDLKTFPRGDLQEMLVIRSDASFSPPYNSCRYTLTVSSDVRITRAAAFLVHDTGGDTTYRPVYRQMDLDFKPDRDTSGTLYLDRPRREESLLIYLWVSSRPTVGKAKVKGRPGREFGVTLTDMVPQ
jgi:TIR domain-containing protein